MTETKIDNDVQGPVLSGTFSGTVNMDSSPRTPAEYAKAAWLLMVTDQSDRRTRQKEFDTLVDTITDRLDRLERRMVNLSGWMIVSGIGAGVLTLGFGWLLWMAVTR